MFGSTFRPKPGWLECLQKLQDNIMLNNKLSQSARPTHGVWGRGGRTGAASRQTTEAAVHPSADGSVRARVWLTAAVGIVHREFAAVSHDRAGPPLEPARNSAGGLGRAKRAGASPVTRDDCGKRRSISGRATAKWTCHFVQCFVCTQRSAGPLDKANTTATSG